MKAINGFGPKDVRLVDLPDPVPGEGQVLVRVLASGICGSDKWLWRAQQPVQRVAGHEVAGEVVAPGPNVRRLRVGQRVAINNVVGCGRCPACRAGAYVKCPYWDGSADVNGGFGELLAAPEHNCLVLDDALESETGAQIFDNFGTPYSAIQHAGIQAGDDVLVMGCGPIGLAAVILAKLRGAYVIASDPLPTRLAFAASLGADAGFPPDSRLPDAVREVTGGLGARFVLECSGKGPAYPLGLASLRHEGTFVSIGEGAQYDLHPSQDLIRRYITMRGSWYSSMPQGAELQRMILQRQFDPRVLISHRAPLAGFPGLFAQVCEQPDQVIKALIVSD